MKTIRLSVIFLLLVLNGSALMAQAVYDKIVFSRMESQNDWDLWLMNRDGTGQVKLINNAYRDTGPCFNPQGTKITFGRISSMMPMTADIYIVNPDGTGETNLTNVPQITGTAMSPKFSWDGSKIVFDVMNTPGNGDLYIINPDGTGLTALLTDTGDDSSPHFSPDGQWVVFMRQISMNPNPKSKICKVHISGSPVVDLTSGNYLDETPVFAADGTHILFKRGFTEWDLYLMPSDHNPAVETDLVNMTNSPASPAGTALYSWEGDKIVYFTSVNASSPSDIYIMDINGANKTRITNDSYIDFDPSFSPSAPTLLFQQEDNQSVMCSRVSDNLVISFNLKSPTAVAMTIRDISGRTLYFTDSGMQPAGTHQVKIPVNLPEGIYFIIIQTQESKVRCKIVI